ncbi:MAG: prephenate dehydrogenase [Candidatus Omnitrophica bacterium]|nr:prephenate dehydrogenase [Candidatus Omnitrophota bacterium]
MFNKVVIIGTGLIGGSLGLDLRKKHLAGQVIGLSRKKENANLAKRSGAIDSVGPSLDVVKDADLVILAAPVDAIMDMAPKIADKLKKDCIVIDVGSSKEKIVSKLSALIPNFLGCHPLTGSEKRGAANLGAGIFSGSVCVITPTPKTVKKTLEKIKLLWQKLGSSVVILSAKKHDRILASTSHLPHTIAFSLIGSVPNQFLNLSSGGLKDTTRIASSDARLWSQIFLSNRGNLLAALSSFQVKLNALKLALKNKNKKLLTKILASAQKKRKKLR